MGKEFLFWVEKGLLFITGLWFWVLGYPGARGGEYVVGCV